MAHALFTYWRKEECLLSKCHRNKFIVIVLSLEQLHYHVCLWLLLLYFWFAQTFLSEKKRKDECEEVFEEQPSVVFDQDGLEPMTWFWLHLPHRHLSKLYHQLPSSSRVALSRQVLWGNCRMEIWGLIRCIWPWTLGNYQALICRFLTILCTLASGNYADTAVCWVALGTSRSAMLPGDWIAHFTPSQHFISDGWGGRNNLLIDQRISVAFLCHMERGGPYPSAVILFAKDLGKGIALTMLRSVFSIVR